MIPETDACAESEEFSVTIQKSSNNKKKGAEPKKKPKKLRSIRLSRLSSLRTRGKSQFDYNPVILSSETDSSDSRSESSSGAMELSNQSSGARKPHFKASPRNSESGSDFSDKNRKGLNQSSPNSSTKSVKSLTRKSSMRVLTKTISLKHQRPFSMRKGSLASSQPPDLGVHNKATCSSTLKGLKIPDDVEIQAEGGGVLVKKVCPYSYCSLHGHKHDASPPLKQFVSTRRGMLKSQKGTKPENHSPQRAKQSGNKKKRSQNPEVREMANSGKEAKLKEASIAGDDGATIDIENAAEVVLGEASEENLQQIHCIDLKEEGVAVSNLDNASNNLEDEDLAGISSELSGESDVLIPNNGVESTPITSLAISASVSDSLQESSADIEEREAGELSGESKVPITEDEVESPPITSLAISASVSNALQEQSADIEEREAGELSSESNVPISEDEVESTLITSLAVSASVSNALQEQSADMEGREGDAAPDSEGFPELMVSDQQSSTDEQAITPLRKQNYSGLWNLIYQHMASDIAAKDGPIDEANKGNKEEDANTLLRMNSTGSSQGISRTNSNKFSEDQNVDSQEIELNQTDAIKLVQEAINGILYPGTRELSSDEQSVTSDTISEPDLDILNSTDLDKDKFGEAGRPEVDCKMLEDQDMLLKPKNNHVHRGEKGAPKEMSKSKQMASNRWSNLKKVILMKRFVKAIDRARKINPQKPNYLPLEPDPESEKVSLRRKTTEERKNAEKFMLDYALQQVISKLAPAQKKRVELLVNAFETVIPPGKNETPRFRINPRASFPVNHVQIRTGSSEQTAGATGTGNNGGHQGDSLHAQKSLDASIKMHQDQVCNSLPAEQHSEEKLPEIKQATSGGHKEAELGATDTDQIVRDSFEEGGSKFISKIMETTSLISSNGDRFEMSESSTPESTAINSVISSRSVLQSSEPMASYNMNEEAKPANKVFPKLSPQEESQPDCSTDATPETPLAKQNYTRLWYLVYKHMASGVSETDETQPPNEADKKDQVSDVESDTSGSLHDLSVEDQDMRREDDKADKQKKKLQDEAVKLVQEAIDQILLPEVEDRFSDNQSICSDTPAEQELLEKNSETDELFNSTSTAPVKETCRNPDIIEVAYSTVPDPGEALHVSKNLNNQGEKTTLKEGGKSNMRAPKNWSNLKKLIILRRFVKALEKVRKFNPRAPRFLPLEPDAESEKVNLKRQDTDDRKNAEEWMLDYAIQQVVTKLTPARKKKVQLLVEAFETVTPPMETEPYMRRSPAASSCAHPFKSVFGH